MNKDRFCSLMLLAIAALLCLGLPVLAQVPMNYQYIYDNIGQLVRVIDSDGNVVTYNYDATGNIVSITRTTVDALGPPLISAVVPGAVNQGEGVELAIRGTNLFQGVLTLDNPGITIAGFRQGDIEIGTTLLIAADAPQGPATLTVTTPLGVDTAVLFILGPRPRINSFSPNRGVSTGGTPVTLSGENLTSDTTITIGGTPATDVVFIDSETMTARTPVSTPGSSVDVVVSNLNGTDTLLRGFIYSFPYFAPGAFAVEFPVDPGGLNTFTLTLDEPVLVDTVVTLLSSNPSVATVPAAVTILAGETSVDIPVTALGEGVTIITMDIGGVSLTTTIFVSGPFTESLNPILAPVMGTFVTPAVDGPILADPVGAFVIPTKDGPTLAPPVGVFVIPTSDGPTLAPPVGVFVTPTTDGPILAPPVGVCVATALMACNDEFDALGR